MQLSALRRAVKAVPALLAACAVMAPPALAITPPKVTVSLGDSITQAFNTGVGQPTCRSAAAPTSLNCPENSWSTGTNPAVNSQFQRIQAIAPPGLNPVAFNASVSGARASGLVGQAQNAVTQNPDYATILIGGNDACRNTIAEQTPTATFRTQVKDAIDTLVNANPEIYIQVVSIPDINRLHTLFTSPLDLNALTRWGLLNVCQALLSNATSNATADVDRRAAFRAQVIAYNEALADVCAEYSRCKFDDNAAFDAAFTAGDVSTVVTTEGLGVVPWSLIPIFGPGNPSSTADYFHPSRQGQVKVAEVTWGSTFAWDATCNSVLVGGTYNDVTVPEDGICVLDGVTVEGKVKVERNAYLEIDGGSVAKDVKADKALTVYVHDGAVIDHYLEAKQTQQLFAFDSTITDGKLKAEKTPFEFGAVYVCGMTVQKGDIEVKKSGSDILIGDPLTQDCTGNSVLDGSVTIEDNRTDVELIVRGNSISKDLKVKDNKGPSEKAVESNTGGKTLECKGNESPFSASGNTGWTKTKYQC